MPVEYECEIIVERPTSVNRLKFAMKALPCDMFATRMRNFAHSADELAKRIAEVKRRIAEATARAGRSAADITLVAVGKAHPPGMVREAIAAGLTDFGENKVQEAEQKIP